MRADRLLVERGLFESRAKAQAAIAAGLVTADGAPVRKASDEIAVRRGTAGHARASLGVARRASSSRPRSIISASIRTAASASTSAPRPAASPKCCWRAARAGSTPSMSGTANCMRACAAGPRSSSMEATDIRTLDPPGSRSRRTRHRRRQLHLAQAGAAGGACAGRAARELVALIKPQFEAGRDSAQERHRARPGVHAAVCDDIRGFVRRSAGRVLGIIPSPIAGGDGNREFLLGARA